eukprot:TRINITY_DN3823_c0_g1_i3.p1 TRINITY_DN3823_c0_g1~~TRINITY_DN3823_c0_g1_i3.p1  ORF type:complete len:321 (-),score=69.82 TRINITY_DN3823_c0_g1_i3:283-1245(-)
MIRRPPRSTLSSSSAASDVYKRQVSTQSTGTGVTVTMSSLTVSVLTDGVIVFTGVATNSRYNWKLPAKEDITIRIPRKKLDSSKAARGHKEPSPSRHSVPARRKSPSRHKHDSAPRADDDEEFSEVRSGVCKLQAQSHSYPQGNLSDLSSDDMSDQQLGEHLAKVDRATSHCISLTWYVLRNQKRSKVALTARQRCMADGDSFEPLLSIQDPKKPDKVYTKEELTKKRLQAKKRKIQQEEAAEKTKQETIDKILNAKGEKYRREVKQRTNQQAQRRAKDLDVAHVRWRSAQSATHSEFSTLSFASSVDLVPPLFQSLFIN